MNQEILQLVQSLSCGDFENFDGQHKRMFLWNQIMITWNETHEPKKMKLRDICAAFLRHWPATSLQDVEYRKSFFISFLDVVIYFELTKDGFARCRLCSKEESIPMQDICMTADHLAELALHIAAIPLSSQRPRNRSLSLD